MATNHLRSKHQLLLRVLIAIMDREDIGPASGPMAYVDKAAREQSCDACGEMINVGDPIEKFRWMNGLTADLWRHQTCRNLVDILLDVCIGQHADVIMENQADPARGGTCLRCGRSCKGDDIVRIRRIVSLSSGSAVTGDYVHRRCASVNK